MVAVMIWSSTKGKNPPNKDDDEAEPSQCGLEESWWVCVQFCWQEAQLAGHCLGHRPRGHRKRSRSRRTRKSRRLQTEGAGIEGTYATSGTVHLFEKIYFILHFFRMLLVSLWLRKKSRKNAERNGTKLLQHLHLQLVRSRAWSLQQDTWLWSPSLCLERESVIFLWLDDMKKIHLYFPPNFK